MKDQEEYHIGLIWPTSDHSKMGRQDVPAHGIMRTWNFNLKISRLQMQKNTYYYFLCHFLRNPKAVGALAPFSKRAADQLIKELHLRPSSLPSKILEVGAGTGNITEAIVETMKEHDSLDLIEIDEECCTLLKKKFGNDPRIHVHCLSVLDWAPNYQYDFIISTLPLNSFSRSFVEKVLNHFQSISNKAAVCTYPEYIGVEWLNRAISKKGKRNIINSRRKFLIGFHKNHLLERNKVFSNFPPCYIYHMSLSASK